MLWMQFSMQRHGLLFGICSNEPMIYFQRNRVDEGILYPLFSLFRDGFENQSIQHYLRLLIRIWQSVPAVELGISGSAWNVIR